MSKTQKLKIVDDDCMIAVVNADKYNATLPQHRDKWTWGELKEFWLVTNRNNLIMWETGLEEDWTVEIVKSPTRKKAFRQFEQFIEVSNEKLYLIRWGDLTMTLQFDDNKLPQEDNKDLIIPLDNGAYRVTVKQLFDPEDYDYDPEGKVNFEIYFEPQNEIPPISVDKIAWTNEKGFGNESDVFFSFERNEFNDFIDELIKNDRINTNNK